MKPADVAPPPWRGSGQVEHNRGIRRFSRVGWSAADSEWKHLALTDNIR